MHALVWIALGLVAATTFVLLWNRIVQFLQSTLLPFIRRTLGDRVADLGVSLTLFLDKRLCPAREVLVNAWSTFKYHVLAMRTRYVRKDATTATVTTEAFVRGDDGKVVKQTKVEEIAWHELPDDIRAQMMAQATDSATVDELAVVKRRLDERMTEEGMELVLGDAT